MLEGTPVGGPGGSAACDTCNRPLSDGQRRSDAPDAEADTVIAYTTLASHASTWALRWVSCEKCGAPGDGSADEDGEAIAKATLGFDRRIGAFALKTCARLRSPEMPRVLCRNCGRPLTVDPNWKVRCPNCGTTNRG